jgi:myo-inositol 2-dehydrogenase / D-chiro-inositol 1-dehydrogenase
MPLRFGVIGAGMMGCEHLRNLLALPDAEVAAVADPHEESRQWASMTLGADHPAVVCRDTPGVLGCAPDAIVVATPNGSHA